MPNINPVAAFSYVADQLDVDFTDESSDADGTIVAWDWDFGDGSAHSTAQNPSHTYVLIGSYTVRLTVTDDRGGTHFVEDVLDIDLNTDGPGGVYVPTTAAEWAALGIPVPTVCYACQEASGNLVPTIGSVQLAPNGTGLAYEQSVTGWTRKFVGLAQGNAGARWGSADLSLNRAAGETMCALIYALVAAAGGNRRLLAVQGTTDADWITSAGLVQSRVNGGSNTNGAVDHRHATTVRPYLWSSDATNNITKTFTDLEEITNTHAETLTVGITGIGSPDAGEPPDCKIGLFAFWIAPSRAITKADLQALGWSLAY